MVERKERRGEGGVTDSGDGMGSDNRGEAWVRKRERTDQEAESDREREKVEEGGEKAERKKREAREATERVLKFRHAIMHGTWEEVLMALKGAAENGAKGNERRVKTAGEMERRKDEMEKDKGVESGGTNIMEMMRKGMTNEAKLALSGAPVMKPIGEVTEEQRRTIQADTPSPSDEHTERWGDMDAERLGRRKEGARRAREGTEKKIVKMKEKRRSRGGEDESE